MKYYRHCAVDLNKKGILVNLSQELFLKLHDARQHVEELWEIYSEINNKNNNNRIIFLNDERKRKKMFGDIVRFCKRKLQRNS